MRNIDNELIILEDKTGFIWSMKKCNMILKDGDKRNLLIKAVAADIKKSFDDPKFINNFRSFGEVGILFNKSKIREKIDNLSETCVFVGYSKNHGSEVYRIYKPGTKKVVHFRNVRWMGIMHVDYTNEKQMTH